MKYYYALVDSTLKNRRSFGIAAVVDDEDCMNILESYIDLSSNRTAVDELVKLCNELELELVHLPDVISDFLTDPVI